MLYVKYVDCRKSDKCHEGMWKLHIISFLTFEIITILINSGYCKNKTRMYTSIVTFTTIKL